MRSSRTVRGIAALFSLTLLVAACGDDGDDTTADDTEQADEAAGAGTDEANEAPGGEPMPADSATICDAETRDDVRRFFDEHDVPAAARALRQSLDSMDACIALRERSRDSLTEFLRSADR